MSEPDQSKDLFPALEQARLLSEFLCEGPVEEFSLTPEEAEAAHRLQRDLVHRLRTVHHSQWPRPVESRREPKQIKDNQPDFDLLGTSAP